MSDIVWQPVTVPLSALVPWDRNPKTISKTHAKRLLDLWQRLGQFQTIAIGPSGEVYDGHQRLSVLKAAHGPRFEVQALQADRALTEKEREELTVAAHVGTTGQFSWDELSGWDAGDLQTWGFDAELLQDWNAGAVALATMLESAQDAPPDDPGPQIDRAEELREKWGVESGQLWQLGEHRLICGDCTDAGVVARVMGGEKAALVVTSPPYWVEKEYERERSAEEIQRHIDLACESITSAVLDDARIVINTMAIGRSRFSEGRREVDLLLDRWQDSFKRQGWLLRNVRIWQKEGGYIAFTPQQDMHDMHWEFLGTFWKEPRAQNPCRESWIVQGMWDIQAQTKDVNHPAPFPVEIPERYIKTYLRGGEIVFEPYCGSGTTLIACERLGRRCRAVEISPAYVAVTLQRWADMTGREPVLVTDEHPRTG